MYNFIGRMITLMKKKKILSKQVLIILLILFFSFILTIISSNLVTPKDNLDLKNNVTNSSTSNIYSIYENWRNYFRQSNKLIMVKSVEEMIQFDADEGMIISTNGYYSDSSKGNGTYLIEKKSDRTSNGGTIIALQNGLVACLQLENDTIRVEQFGAKGDGITDNTAILNNAFNSGVSTIVLEENASYKATDTLLLTTSNTTIKGSNSTIFTDNDYKPFTSYQNDAHFIFIKTANNITFDGITVLSKETKRIGHGLQLLIRYGKNITIKNSNFIIPETVLTEGESDTSAKTSYCNISVFTGWDNVTIEDCIITNLSGSDIGGLVGFNGFWKTENKNGYFRRNVCKYKGHDEILAVACSDDSTIYNVQITDNIFYNNYYENKDTYAPPHICFALAYDTSLKVDTVLFESNTIETKSDYAMMLFGNITNATIHKNTISYTKSTKSKQVNPYVFISSTSTLNRNLIIEDNRIMLTDEKNTTMGGITYGSFIFINNSVTCDTPVNILFQNNSNILNNTITTNYSISGITDSVYTFKKNNITLNHVFKFLFQYYSHTLTDNVSIDNNTINYTYLSESDEIFLMLNGITLAGYDMNITNNTVNMNSSTNGKILCFYSIKDSTLQTIRFSNNTMGSFTDISSYQNTLPSQTIICTDNN